MPEFDINDLASIGVVRDVPAHMLPPEAWSLGENVRGKDGGVERVKGRSQIFGTPTVPPHHLLPLNTVSQTFWIYMGLTKGNVWDGTTHTDITRSVGGNYAATDSREWNSTLLGGVPIINNGVDVPQFWAIPTVATRLANLTNWQAAVRAKIVRAFGPYLVAFNITDTGVVFPHLVRWSHPADPGSVPSSWDVTDPTKDTGQTDLPDVNSGVIQEALPLQSTMYIYKENSIWKMTRIGGRLIMGFNAFSETTGILAPRCVVVTGDGQRQVFASQDDILVHNGNSIESILERRQRNRLFNEIDTANANNSFMFANPFYNEVIFCYPSQGQIYPDRALRWNYREGVKGAVFEEDGINFRHAALGDIEGATNIAWSALTNTWEQSADPWSVFARRRVVLASPVNTKMYKLDDGLTRDGVAYNATLQREGLALIGRKRGGEWIVDHQREKMFKGLWPKVSGGPIRIRLGAAQTVQGSTVWGGYVGFDPASEVFVDVGPENMPSGRALALEFSSNASVDWRIDGYRIGINLLGQY